MSNTFSQYIKMKRSYTKNVIFIIVLFYITVLIISPPRYFSFLPSITSYPNNIEEAQLVFKLSTNRTKEDEAFFYKTNKSVIEGFSDIVPESRDTLVSMVTQPKVLWYLMTLKFLFNRARPYHVNPNIPYIYTDTGLTPSYPAGHACQAYFLAYELGKKYPKKQEELDRIAKKCDQVRVLAGIHYPSDGQFSYRLFGRIHQR
jgi:membrane-associated phospholipid phosphatase